MMFWCLSWFDTASRRDRHSLLSWPFSSGLDDVFVAHAAAGLDDGGGARFGRRQKAVGEGEEGVRRHHRTDGAARGVAPDPDTNGVQGF